MELLKKLPVQESKVSPSQAVENRPFIASDDLVIHLSTSQHQACAMSAARKKVVQENAPALHELFDKTVKQKSTYNPTSENWISSNEVSIKGLARMDLHTFLLEAEKLGKTITYTQTLTVQVTD